MPPLSFLDVDPSIRMHVAVATSLATIIPTSIASSRAHYRRDSLDTDLAKRWALFILAGSVLGVLIAARVHSDVLALVFAVMTFLMACKLLLPLEERTLADHVPGGAPILLVPTGIGAVSSMMGIGGGTLSVCGADAFSTADSPRRGYGGAVRPVYQPAGHPGVRRKRYR